MEGIRAWSAALCMAALGCAAIQLLVPQQGIGKVFRLVVNTFFLCCLLVPILKGGLSLPHIDGLPDEVVSDLLEDTVTQQLEKQVSDTVTRMAEEVFAARGITAEKIEVIMDIADNGGIYIEHVAVAVDKQTVPIAKVAGEVLEQQLGVAVEINTM